MVVYRILCRKNGKVYIGTTRRWLPDRWYEHIYDARGGASTPLHRDIRKYGKEAFEIKRLKQCKSLHQLHKTERAYIKVYKACNSRYGYNTLSGGSSTVTWKLKPKKKNSRAIWLFILAVVISVMVYLFLRVVSIET